MKTLTYQDKEELALEFGLELGVILALLYVETSGHGFLPSGRVKILFEGHYFHRLTDGKYDGSHPNISYAKWTKVHYMKDGEKEWDRLNEAIALDRIAAFESASWGIGQTMGENFKKCGYSNVEEMVESYSESEYNQLRGALTFIRNDKIAFHALKVKDFEVFSSRYNGRSYKVNNYPQRLEDAYLKLK